MTKPDKKTDGQKSAGDELRELSKRQKAETRRQNEERQKSADDKRQKALRGRLEELFNQLAAKLPADIQRLTENVKNGDVKNLCIIAYDVDYNEGLKGVAGFSFETLSGYKALDKACRKLNVDFYIVAEHRSEPGFDMTDRKITEHSDHITITVDAGEPYNPGSSGRKLSPGWDDPIDMTR